MHYLSIDFGTSTVKMEILDDALQVLASEKQEYPYILLPGEKVEIDPDVLFAATAQAAQRLPAELRQKVDVLCYDTFSPSPVFIAEDGTLVYPNIITHMDRRSRSITDYIDEKVGKDKYLSIAGIYPFAGGAGIMTVLWMQQNEPEVLDRTYRIGHLPTYVHHRLTGEWMVDLVNASMLGLYETTTQGGWSRELLDAFGLRHDMFSEIRNPGELLGTLLPEEAERLGVPAGIPVAVGTNDMAAAQMGAHNDRAGRIMNTAGSSDMVSILVDEPVTNPGYYLRNSALPGIWQIYATTAGGFGIDWFYDQFCKEMDRDTFNNQYLPSVIEHWAVDGEVTFDPYLTGDRQSLEKRTGAWHGLTLAATRDEMLAAMLKSMNRVLYGVVKLAAEVVPMDKVIKLTGGLSTPAFIKLKEQQFPGFTFEVVDNCSVLGNVELVRHHNRKLTA
ncbi:MAG: FGGY family carbohydrate kinase [Brooklawnia sp.]|uniref:FGGY-family carbohydrate kinase n=1 Tax=Brooklawnia sp. TaxID=2699740 RepID=UPI003C70B34E